MKYKYGDKVRRIANPYKSGFTYVGIGTIGKVIAVDKSNVKVKIDSDYATHKWSFEYIEKVKEN